MRYFPVYLDIQDRPCLVVGGGAVGTRKALTLLQAGARVTVVSPEATPQLASLAAEGRIRLKRRPYIDSGMENAILVFGTTDNRELNRRISENAQRLGVWCNIADQPERGQFVLPAVVARGDLLISIATSGKSPALARRIRREIESAYGPEYARLLDLLGALRQRLLSQGHDPQGHKKLFEALLDSDLLESIRTGDSARIECCLKEHCGDTVVWEDLMSPAQ